MLNSREIDQGNVFLVTGVAAGTPLPDRPAATLGVRFQIPTAGSVTYYVGKLGITPAAPAVQMTVDTAGIHDHRLSVNETIFVTAVTGTVKAHWVG